jgi:hypothetical protein
MHGACFIPEALVGWRRMPEGYSASVTRDVNRAIEIIDETATMMATTYRDIFPPAYVRLWKSRELLHALKNCLTTRQGREAVLVIRGKLPKMSLVDVFFLGILRRFDSRFFATAYFFLKKTSFQKFDALRRHFWPQAPYG